MLFGFAAEHMPCIIDSLLKMVLLIRMKGSKLS